MLLVFFGYKPFKQTRVLDMPLYEKGLSFSDLTTKIGKIEVEGALIFPILVVKSLKDSPFS